MKASIFFIMFLSLSLSLHAQREDIVKLYNQAQMATEMGNLDDAIALYGKVLKMNPQFADGYLSLGNVYVKKGQDVNSLENAISNFSEYLRLKPNAANATDVKTSIDKLQYVLEKAYQKNDNRKLLLGRWASTDGRRDKYNRSLFILDVKEFDNKLQISIEPSSLVYSEDFFTKTVYIDDPNAKEYAISFTNDKNYMPSQAKYALNSQIISSASSQLGSLGGVTDMLGQYLNSKKQEKDLQKKTLTGYDLKIYSTPDENQELKCAVHVYIKEQTPVKEQIVLDTVFDNGFYKVNSDFQNTTPLNTFNFTTGSGVVTTTNPFDGTKHVTINNSVNLFNNSDSKISSLAKSGRGMSWTGSILCGVGLGGVLWGLIDPLLPDGFGSKIDSQLIIGGSALTIVGIPFAIVGTNKIIKATKLYNESLENKRNVSELKVGFTGNGVGLAFAF